MGFRKISTVLLLLAVAMGVFLTGMFFGRRTLRQSFDRKPEREAASESAPISEEPEAAGKLNINEATVQELAELPGIGSVLAERIVEYRESFGPFRTVEELSGVDGIGEKRLAELRDYVTVR